MYEQKQCILIADDEERIVRALKDLLSAKGFHTLTAGNGRAALELCERYRNQIDLALLDVMMPELDGFALLRELRGRNYVLPVIMLTARGEEYDHLQGFQAGADDYVPKPFSTSLLLARIEAVLRRAGRGKAEVMQAGKLLLVPEQRRVEASGQPVELTRREFDLLYCFLQSGAHSLPGAASGYCLGIRLRGGRADRGHPRQESPQQAARLRRLHPNRLPGGLPL